MKLPQYYQFPQYLLGISSDPGVVMRSCLSYGLAVAGANMSRLEKGEMDQQSKPPQPELEAIFSDQRLRHYVDQAFSYQVAAGDSFEKHVERARSSYQFEQDLMDMFGNSPKVRIRRDLMESAIGGWKGHKTQIHVFMALLSVIGDKPGPVLCSYERIIGLCAGCKSRQMFEAMLQMGRLQTNPYTRNQVVYAVKQLTRKGIVAKFVALNRYSYYSTRLNKELLREAVLARYAARDKRQMEEAEKDANANRAIRMRRSFYKDESSSHMIGMEQGDSDLPF